jgi:hypothetical protein
MGHIQVSFYTPQGAHLDAFEVAARRLLFTLCREAVFFGRLWKLEHGFPKLA